MLSKPITLESLIEYPVASILCNESKVITNDSSVVHVLARAFIISRNLFYEPDPSVAFDTSKGTWYIVKQALKEVLCGLFNCIPCNNRSNRSNAVSCGNWEENTYDETERHCFFFFVPACATELHCLKRVIWQLAYRYLQVSVIPLCYSTTASAVPFNRLSTCVASGSWQEEN